MRNILAIAMISAGLLYAEAVNASCWDDDYISLDRMQSCYATGADVNLPSIGWRSMLLRVANILHAGVEVESGILEFLVNDAGADVSLRDEWGRTALYLVNKPEHVDILIQAGADVNVKTSDGWPAVFGHKSLGAVQAVIRGGFNVNATVRDGRETVLGIFVLTHRKAFVDALIQGGANVDSLSNGNPPLCLISYRDKWRGQHAEITKSLIEAGAEIDTNCHNPRISRTSHDDTPLMLAAADGQVDVVRVLLAAGADVNRFDDKALGYACQEYHWSSTRISYGAIIGMLVAAGARRDC